MNVFSIKDVENLSGIQAHTLRIWEQRYSFIKPQRTETNIRHYSEQELRTILNVALLNRFGFRISKIDKMSVEEMQSKIQELATPEASHQKVIYLMLDQMMQLHLDAFEETLSKTLGDLGLKAGMMEVILPFLERVGGLWAVGQIYPAQEHFVTNIIRQKLMAYIDALPRNSEGNKTILLFLPEGEICEIGILFAQYLLKQQGRRCMYLGANVPLEEVLLIAKKANTQVVFCYRSGGSSDINVQSLGNQLSSNLPQSQIVLAGAVSEKLHDDNVANIEILNSFEDIIRFSERP